MVLAAIGVALSLRSAHEHPHRHRRGRRTPTNTITTTTTTTTPTPTASRVATVTSTSTANSCTHTRTSPIFTTDTTTSAPAASVFESSGGVRRIGLPLTKTARTFSMLLMSSSGSPATARKSASLPIEIVPLRSQHRTRRPRPRCSLGELRRWSFRWRQGCSCRSATRREACSARRPHRSRRRFSLPPDRAAWLVMMASRRLAIAGNGGGDPGRNPPVIDTTARRQPSSAMTSGSASTPSAVKNVQCSMLRHGIGDALTSMP